MSASHRVQVGELDVRTAWDEALTVGTYSYVIARAVEGQAVDVLEVVLEVAPALAGVPAGLKDQVNTALGGQYFCGPQFRPGSDSCPDFQLKVKRPEIPTGVQGAFEQNRTSRILITTKDNEVRQRAKEAQAIRQVRGQLSPEYVLLRAIERGDIDFWVLPQRGNLTLPAPPAGR